MSGGSTATSAAKVVVVALALAIFAAAAAGIWRIADERDEANCIAAAEAATPVLVIPVEPSFVETDKGRISGRSERQQAVEECD